VAALITHLVVGERVYQRLGWFGPGDYGPFLLGCVLVDVHLCCRIRRRETHFAERLDRDGPHAVHKSCANFIGRLDQLLARPWEALARGERAFISGYLCHLAADEEWKRFDVETLQRLGFRWWRELAVPGDVILTPFDVLSSALYRDHAAVTSALDGASVPDVLTHIPHRFLEGLWSRVKAHAMDGRTVSSYLQMQRGLGKTEGEVRAAEQEHAVYFDQAVELVGSFFGGAPSRIDAMVGRSLEAAPRLRDRPRWVRPAAGGCETGRANWPAPSVSARS
jgi:hypothetical protein